MHRLTILIPDDAYEQLREHAHSTRKSMGEILRTILDIYLPEWDGKWDTLRLHSRLEAKNDPPA